MSVPVEEAAPGGLSEALSQALCESLGAGVLERHEPVAVGGREIAASLRPRDGAELATCLRALGEHGLAALVRGGGTRMALGNLPVPSPGGAEVFLSTERLRGVIELDAQDGVVKVAAGTPLSVLRDAALPEGWELPLDAPGEGATVGGVLASAGIGPRRLGLGPPRDGVLGLDVALATGERTRCGGRVVKNVTGYDLQKLYTGSLGTLGVIEAAWLRLRPVPERREVLAQRVDADAVASGPALEAARRGSARCLGFVSPRLAARVAPGAEGWLLVAELAGDDASVARDLAWLREHFPGDPLRVAGDCVERLAALQGDDAFGLRTRLAVLPGRCEAARSALASRGVDLVAHPGLALLYTFGALDLGELDEVVRSTRGELLLEVAPLSLKRERDVFGAPGAEQSLARALKQRFDPKRVLNPGRARGRL